MQKISVNAKQTTQNNRYIMKVKRRWIILMTAMTLIAVSGLAHIGERELAEYEEHIREKERVKSE